MPSINVDGAAARLRAFGTNTPGHCLEFVWRAISQGQVHYLSGGAASAYATWQATDPASRHNGDRNVPKDMPAYFGPRPGNALGDVIISNGDGTFTATDRPNGHVGVCTLDQRGIQIGRPYLGWAETMGGYTLTSPAMTTAGTNATPITPEEDDMFADTDRTRLDAVYAALFGPANLPVPQMTWAKPFGETPGVAYYGLLDIAIYSQTLIAGLSTALSAMATAQGLDGTAITKAAHDGAAQALTELTLVAKKPA